MIDSGMRVDEVCVLTPSDIDIKARLIHVTKTITRKEGGV